MKKLNFEIFSKFFFEIFFFEIKFFEIFFLQPQKFIFFTCFKHQKWILHEGLTLLTSSKTKRQAFEVVLGGFNPPPPLCNKIELWGHFHGDHVKIEYWNETYLEIFPDSGLTRISLNFSYSLSKSWWKLTKCQDLFSKKIRKIKFIKQIFSGLPTSQGSGRLILKLSQTKPFGSLFLTSWEIEFIG